MSAPSEKTRPLFEPRGRLAELAAATPVSNETSGTLPRAIPEAEAGKPYLPGYEILGELGRGGMGVVYKARQVGLKRLVAIKMILAGVHAAPEQRERFLAEARAAARLQHPNVVQVYDVAEHEGRPYFSLEYVGGGNLAQKLDGTPLPPRQAAAMLSTLASAIQSAHELGIVHRDLKPANVMLTDKGMPKITDFGLAKELDQGDGPTGSGAIVGTPCYMAPEQALGHASEVGPTTDVYALGAILYEMLTGRPPLRGETPMDTLMQVVSQDPVPPTQLQPKVPRDLELICLKCLQKEPRKRFANGAQLAEEVRRFLKGEPLQYTRPVGRGERAWRWCRRNPTIAFLTVAVACSLFAGIVVSSSAALMAHLSARRAEREKDRAEYEKTRADAKAEEAEVNARRAGHERFEAQLLSAGLSLSRGQATCEKGDVAHGLLWIGNSLRLLPAPTAEPGAAERVAALERVIRTNLSGWHPELNALRGSFEHGGWVNSACFSPDGRWILTGSDDHVARIWDAQTGAAVGEPIQHGHYVSQALFSPDGRTVLTAGWDGNVRLWDAGTRKPIGVPLKVGARVTAVAFSANGNVVGTGSYDGSVRLSNAHTGAPIGAPIKHVGFQCLRFSPDSQTLITGGLDGAARQWDPATGLAKGVPLEHKPGVVSLAIHPEGKLLATGGRDGMARFWDLAAAKPAGLAPLQHQGLVTAMEFSRDGKLILTGSSDCMARLSYVRSGQLVCVPLQHHAAVRAVAFSPDGNMVATASADSSARVWVAGNGMPQGSWLIHQGDVIAVAFSRDGRSVLSGSHDKTARLWQLSEPRPSGIIDHDVVQALALSSDGKKLLSAGGGNSVCLWTHEGDKWQPRRFGQDHTTFCVAFSRDDSRFVTGSTHHGAAIWDAGRAQPIHRLPHQGAVYAVACSPSADVVATGCEDGVARIWDVNTGKPGDVSFRHPDIVYALAYSPNGRMLATGCEDGGCRLWDLTSGKPIGEPLHHPGGVRTLAFTFDNRTIVTGCNDGTVRSWDVASHKPAGPPLRHVGEIHTMALNSTGALVLASSADGITQLWDRGTGKVLSRPFLHAGAVHGVVFSRDDKLAFTGCDDHLIRFWPIPTAMGGTVEDVTRWMQVGTGMTLNDDGVASMLSAKQWEQARRQQ